MCAVYDTQNKEYIAFSDRSPAAAHHIQVIPKRHIGTRFAQR
jgi:diadenosine tetraphosphate (Ap4A) HIT family hydrolase